MNIVIRNYLILSYIVYISQNNYNIVINIVQYLTIPNNFVLQYVTKCDTKLKQYAPIQNNWVFFCTFFWNYWYNISPLSNIVTDLMIVSIVSKRANSWLNCDNWCGVLSFVLFQCVLFDVMLQYCNSAVVTVLKVCFEMQTVTMYSGRIFAVQSLQTHGAFLKPLWKIRELHWQVTLR